MKRIDVDRISTTDIRERYLELRPDGHWFDKDTMRFFQSRLPLYGYRDPRGVIWFVTGEKGPSTKTKYTVRRMDLTGDIATVGEFMAFPTHAFAREELYRQIEQENRKGETA